MKNICITYGGGTYGTFLEWAMYRFSELYKSTDLIVPDLPFNDNGNSHRFRGNMPQNHEAGSFFQSILPYMQSNKNHTIVRFHPKFREVDNLLDSLEYVSKNFKKVIHLTSTVDSVAWTINNKFEKTTIGSWLVYKQHLYQHDLKGWNKNRLADMEQWELREFLSFFNDPQHVYETQNNPLPERLTNIKIVPITELRDNLKDTLLAILDYCELAPANLDKFEEVRTGWIQRQYHCNKDSLIKQIVDSVMLDTKYDWKGEELTLVDEALVQYYLRENGLEIKCNNLNKFPSNSVALKKITYYV